MSQNCDPCVCPQMWYKDLETWRKGVLTLLCRTSGVNNVQGGAYIAGSPLEITGAVRKDVTTALAPSDGTYGPLQTDASSRLRANAPVTADGIVLGGTLNTYLRAFANVAASSTDSVLVAAVPGKTIVVLQLAIIAGTVATTITLNSKSGGVGTAISPAIYNDINSGEVLPFSPAGWMQTNQSEGLSVTTSAGSTTSVIVSYYTF